MRYNSHCVFFQISEIVVTGYFGAHAVNEMFDLVSPRTIGMFDLGAMFDITCRLGVQGEVS